MTPARVKRRRRRIVALSLITIYALTMTLGGCADRLILWPSRDHRDPGPAKPSMIPSPRGVIEVFTAQSSGNPPRGFVLEFCGNATRAEEIAQFVADRWKRHDIEAWVMNYPGYGKSEGRALLGSIPAAALTAYDRLKTLAGDRPIFLEGNSLGTVTALYVAAHRPVAGLVLQNPPPLHRLILHRHGWWNLWLVALPVALQVPNALDSLSNAPRVHAPAVFLMAGGDTLVPPVYQRLVLDAYAGPKRVIDMSGSTHWSSVTGDAERQLSHEIDRLCAEAGLP